MLSKTFSGLSDHILGDEFVGLKEIVEGHGAILLVLRLTKSLALLDHLVDELSRGLRTLKLSLLFRLLLSDDEAAEGLELLVFLEVVMLAGMSKVLEVEAELLLKSVGGLAHLDGLDLGGSLRARGELEGLQLAEHLHVALELELGGADNLGLVLRDIFGLKSHANLAIFLLELLALLRVLHVLLDGELVVLRLELDPLAGLLGHGNDGLLELVLALAEDSDVLLLVLLAEGLHLLLVEGLLLGDEGAHRLTRDDGTQNHVVVVLESAVEVCLELAVRVHGCTHGELGVLILVGRLGASK